MFWFQIQVTDPRMSTAEERMKKISVCGYVGVFCVCVLINEVLKLVIKTERLQHTAMLRRAQVSDSSDDDKQQRSAACVISHRWSLEEHRA